MQIQSMKIKKACSVVIVGPTNYFFGMIRLPFAARKSLGQNFLVDPNIVRKIVQSIDPQPHQSIIEIGAGTGILTRPLAASGASLLAIEIDDRAFQILSSDPLLASNPRTKLLHTDFLSFDLETALPAPLRVVGNLPYNITSQILFHLLEQPSILIDAVFMIQREVAERIVAKPKTKEYGILSVMLQLHADVSILFHVPPTVFVPRPKVESSVISLEFTQERIKLINNYALFRQIVRQTFGKRRKTLWNSLRAMQPPVHVPVERLGSKALQRPEELSPIEFIDLANLIDASRPQKNSHGA